MKYLIWIAIIYLAWRWFSASRAQKAGKPESPPATNQPAADPPAETMVKCQQCDLHLPLSEALTGPGNQFFCSPSHRDMHRTS